MSDAVKAHPNAAAALIGGGGLGAFLVYLVGFLVPDLPSPFATFIGGALAALVLFIGRKGLRGLLRAIWRGAS